MSTRVFLSPFLTRTCTCTETQIVASQKIDQNVWHILTVMELLRLCAAFLLFLRTWVSGIIITKDAHVTCLFYEDCVLPCSFKPTGAVVIHWYKQQIPVHSYYYNKDQYGLQNKHFSGRTNLFNSQIAQGNASLVLRKVKVQDQGRYKCYTSTRKGNQETFVNLGVKALIQFVKIEMVEERVICLSQNIYPAPEVTWATDPPTDSRSLQNFTRKTSDSKGLFTIESSISMIGNTSDHTYFCSVVSADEMQVWTASLHHQDELFGEEGSGLLVPCMVPQPRHNFTLTWTFIRTTESIVIFTYDSRTRRIANLWESKAELDIDQAHLGNGSLHLLNPDSLGHSGTYICTFYGFQMRHQVQTHVNITVRVTDDDEYDCRRSWWGTAASVFIFLITVSVALSRCFRLRGGHPVHGHSDINKRIRCSNKSEIPVFERQGQDEPRRNGLESVETDIHRAPSNTTLYESSKPLKQHPDGFKNEVLPHTPTENSMIKTCMIITDSSTPDTPEERHESRPQTPAGAIITRFTSEINTEASDDTDNERNELESESHSADGAEMEITVIKRFHNKYESSTPELSQINGFR
ncbi:uncharacterized protein LOC107728835 isoform X2 [Sinocyclocheilus rhinocerous]|uniref:uncharacterized protein LOC107728835 isoform X2 n=1 Tax=Sinocyclocheilus rhinocerous TaxID=307959 RepID=UPI0007B8E7F0|nr:PREDICTED: uncharacterized protein LOC107728835 isoform X2 [Sinocyclocheilus rhinocerous]